MARQSINVNPGVLEFEAYMDFSGGLNTETSNEKLNDNEFTQMQNIDLNSRGSVKKRTGRDLLTTTGLPVTNAQGVFFFYRKKTTQTEPDIIFAANGKLYVKKYDTSNNTYFSSASLLPITGMSEGFATNIIVEAVQYYNQLYIATGTNLVVVTINETNGQYSANVVEPYEPNANELKFIGTNALLGFSMNDKVDTTLTEMSQFSVRGMTFSDNGKLILSGEVNNPFNISAYVVENQASIPSGWNYSKSYTLYYRKVDLEATETLTITSQHDQTEFAIPFSSSYEPNTNSIEVFVDKIAQVSGVDYQETNSNLITFFNAHSANKKITLKWNPSWRTGNSKIATMTDFSGSINPATFRALEKGFYDFKVGVTFLQINTSSPFQTTREYKEYKYEGFQIKTVYEDGDILKQEIAGVKKCNRIRLYWDRLMLFGDPDEPTQLYFSDINNPAYFPQVNTLRFDTGKQEAITSVVRLHDYLVIFSKSSIYALTGKTKDEFTVNLINDNIGCIAPRSAVLTGNVVTFLSEEGVYSLRPSTFKLDQLNVQRVDTKIKKEIKKSNNACALNYDSQYWLCYPDDKIIYRYYFEKGVWVKDFSDKLDFVQFLQDGKNIYTLSKDVKLYKNNENIYTDAGIPYNMIVESKYFDLSKSFNFKKLRRLYILGRGYIDHDAEYKVKVYADSQIVLDPEVGYAVVGEDGYVTWYPTNQNPVPPTPPNIEFHQATMLGTQLNPEWVLGEDILGGQELSVHKTRIRGKCRRAKLVFENSQAEQVELFGFGLEFKLKKP